MNTQKFDINDPRSRQIFINLRLSGFSLDDITTAIGVSYSTTKRIYEELRPEIHAQMLKNKQQKSHSLTDKVDAFLASLEKHFYIIDEAMIGSYGRMNYEEYIASMLKFTNANERLVKLRILLASSQSLLKSPNEPCDPQNGSNENIELKENSENVLQSSLIADESENVLQSSLIAETKNPNEPRDPQNGSNVINENVLQSSLIAETKKPNKPCDPQNGSKENKESVENVLQSSLIAEKQECETKNSNEPCDPQNSSNKNKELKENSENAPQSSLLEEKEESETKNSNEPCDPQNGSNKNNENKPKINNENISYFKYRKLKLSEMKKQNETINNNSLN